MRVGVICSAHGYGHVGRQLATVEALADAGQDVILVTAAPVDVVGDRPGVTVLRRRVDVGIAQADSVTEDPERTRALWCEAVEGVDALVEDVRGLDCAIVDVAPTALEACRRAGVPALAVGNFDWAWVYEHYPALAEFAPKMRAWQSRHVGISLSPGPGLTGFARATPLSEPLARSVRPHRPAALAPRDAMVLVAFGGLGLANLGDRLPRLRGVRWVLTPPQARVARKDIVYVAADEARFPALLAAADVVYTKPGYGVLAEATLAGVRLCWMDRGAFPEAPYLEAAMVARGDVKVVGDDVAAAIRCALASPRPSPVPSQAARTLASAVLRRDF